jgi:uncharacterized protein (TIGR02246 family)
LFVQVEDKSQSQEKGNATMKTIAAICFVLILSTFNANAEQGDAQDQAHSELKVMLGDIEAAINKKDIDALGNMMSPDVVVTFLNGEVARGVPAVRAYFEKTLGGQSAILKDYRTSAQENAPARLLDNVALADGVANDEFIFADGSEMSVTTHWSTVVVKQDGQWKVAQLHFSSNIFDNPLVSAAEKSLAMVGGIALVLGLILGFLVGRKTRK